MSDCNAKMSDFGWVRSGRVRVVKFRCKGVNFEAQNALQLTYEHL